MRVALLALNWATDGAFILLAAASVRQYLRHPQRHRLDLAAAILLLTIVAVIGRVEQLLPMSAQRVLSDLDIFFFLASGYAFLRFRADFIPIGRSWEIGVAVFLALVCVATIFVGLPGPGQKPSPA